MSTTREMEMHDRNEKPIYGPYVEMFFVNVEENDSSFSVIRYFLPNLGKILPALMEKSKIKYCPQWELNPEPPDQSNVLLTQLSHYLVAFVNHQGLCKLCTIDSRKEQSPKCEVGHKPKLTSEISCQTHVKMPCTVSRVLEQ